MARHRSLSGHHPSPALLEALARSSRHGRAAHRLPQLPLREGHKSAVAGALAGAFFLAGGPLVAGSGVALGDSGVDTDGRLPALEVLPIHRQVDQQEEAAKLQKNEELQAKLAAAEQAAQEAVERRAAEQAAAEQAAAEQAAAEQAAAEQAAAEQAAAEQAAAEQAAAEQAAAEQAAAEQAAAEQAAAEQAAAEQAAADVQFVKPAEGRFTSGFGARWGTTHYGVDIANSIGTPIYSTTSGTVISSGPASGFGMWVRVQHDDGTITVYGHIDQSLVSVGQRVGVGEQIATMGNRGQSTGPHLHFEVHVNGQKIDPQPWLAERGITL
ncbi:M23 family metallopeptidase [Actinoalloteichus spitiensis]|uniref:M23 family metallopeptidase n=1 Tax=Actinoalloteichus spitiensis TaxID=252394 RepID=UPI000474D886|nr:M23 family metallopeptidase [Actinoalloteichus spitiensis]